MFDDKRIGIIYLIFNINKILNDLFQSELSAEGLFHGQSKVLIALSLIGRASQSDIAKLLGIAPATVTHIVQRLECLGLVSRETDVFSGRAQMVSLTGEGQEAADAAAVAWGNLGLKVMNGFDEDKVERLYSALEMLQNNLGGKMPPLVEYLNRRTGVS